MFKKILAIILTGLFCLSLMGFSSSKKENEGPTTPLEEIEQSVLVRPNTNEDFRYNVYTYYVEISECLSTKSNIVIPDTIQNLPVYKICNKAFQGQTTFTSVIITNNVIEIGDDAFSGCTNLTSLTLPNKLLKMGANAFRDCKNLKEVEIPGTLIEIPGGAFEGCERLLSVTINKGTENIKTEDETGRTICGGAFGHCMALTAAWIPNDITVIDNGAFDGSTENIIICGFEESAAAIFAAQNLLDFKTESEFKNISKTALEQKKIGINEPISSTLWKLSLQKVYEYNAEFNYVSGSLKTETPEHNSRIVFLTFALENLSSSKQYFNFLNFNITVDDYARRASSYGIVSSLGTYSTLLNGEVETGATITGYIAVKVPENWETLNITYKGDVILESSIFEIINNEKYVNYIAETTTQNQEETDTPSETNDINPTEPLSEPVNIAQEPSSDAAVTTVENTSNISNTN